MEDIAYRFNVSQQDVSVIFRTWINYMFYRMGEISLWPKHDVLSKYMPQGFYNKFPRTFAKLDCTVLSPFFPDVVDDVAVSVIVFVY